MRRQLDNTIGYGASIAMAVETMLFAASLIIDLSVPSDLGLIMSYVVSIFLAASIVIMLACFCSRTTGERRILGLLALVAAIMYAPFCIAVYFLQLAVVIANPLNHPAEVLKLIAFVPGSPAFALDMLGYGFLCLSTLAAAFALQDPRDKALRILCLIHGAIAIPTFTAPIISGVFRPTNGQANDIGSWILLFWCALFTPISILFARLFLRNTGQALEKIEKE